MAVSKRLKGYITTSYVKLNFLDVIPEETFRVGVKRNFDTACWSYYNNAHTIFIGDKIFDTVDKDYDDRQEIIMKFLYHELGHAIYTERDFKVINKKLEDAKVPFQLFNLFEDAKIEHLLRSRFGLDFNWTNFWPIPEDSVKEKASTTFFKIIQTENREYFSVPFFEKAHNYYEKAIKTKTLDEMIDLMKDWMREFPNDISPSEDTNKNPGQGPESDLQLGYQIANDSKLQQQFENGSEMVVDDAENAMQQLEEDLDNESNKSVKFLGEEFTNEEITLESSNSTDIFNLDNGLDKEDKIDDEVLHDVCYELEKILIDTDYERQNSKKVANQFNIKNVIKRRAGDLNSEIYKKNTEIEDFNNKKITLVIDLSSSMAGKEVQNAKILAIALNRLVSKGCMSGELIGSKVRGDSIHQAIKLPTNDALIQSCKANGSAEGIGYAISEHMETINKSDYVFVFTDGRIRDKDLEFIKQGNKQLYEKMYGVYVGNSKNVNTKDMGKWFNNTLINKSIIGLAKDIAALIENKNNINQNKIVKDEEEDFSYGIDL